MVFDLAKLGQWTDDVEFKVSSEVIARYAAATNDDNPRHAAGQVAPPLFPAVTALIDVASKAISTVWPPETPGFDMRRVHGEEDVHAHRGVFPGMTLRSRAACVGLRPKRSGCVLVTRTESRDDGGQLVNEAVHRTFIRGLFADSPAGEDPPNMVMPLQPDPARFTTVRYQVDADQSFRYAEASRDKANVHLDPQVAKEAGFEGVIVHGLCTMAFATRALVAAACEADSARLKRVAVRFTRPLLPGQPITTKIWQSGERNGRSVYAFEVDDASGLAVIEQGIAEVQR